MIFGKKAFYYVGFTLTNLLTKVLFESWESQAMKKLPVELTRFWVFGPGWNAICYFEYLLTKQIKSLGK